MRPLILKGIIFFCCTLPCAPNSNGQVSKQEFEELSSKVATLEYENYTLKNNVRTEMDETKRKVEGYAPMFLLLFLYGTVCALWAQGANRSPVAWFISGMIFSVFTAITMIYINGRELRNRD